MHLSRVGGVRISTQVMLLVIEPIDYLRRKLQLLHDQIQQIDRQIEDRERLLEQRLNSIQRQRDRYLRARTDRRLLTDLTGEPEYTKALGQLHALILQTEHQLSYERIAAWRDIQELRKERRRLETERAQLQCQLDQ